MPSGSSTSRSHAVGERLTGHRREDLPEDEGAEVRVARSRAGLERELAVLREQPVEEGRRVGWGRVGRVDPLHGDRVDEPSAVREQVATRDPYRSLARCEAFELRHRWVDGRVEIEYAVRRHRRIASVAVTIFVIENHGQTMSTDAGSRAARLAIPLAAVARTPSGPTTAMAMPGTRSPTVAASAPARSMSCMTPPSWFVAIPADSAPVVEWSGFAKVAVFPGR